MMNRRSFMAGILGVFLFAALPGCPTNNQNQNPTRPAPVRPTRPAPVRPSPTKRIPGVSSIAPRDLMTRVTRIRTSVEKNDWTKANKETNALGTDMTRLKASRKGKSGLSQMTAFDKEYVKLQASVKARNRQNALRDLDNLEKIIKDMKM